MVRIVERERRPRRAKERKSAPERILPALSKQEVPLQRDVVSRKLRSELRDLFVQQQHALVGGLGFIGDCHKQGEPVLAEQRSLRRAHEATCDVERRQASCVPMSERLAEPADIISGATHQPIAPAPMRSEPLLIRNLPGRRDADQVVREPDCSTGLDGDAARDKLTDRPLDPVDLPPLQLGPITKREGTPGNCEQREQPAGVPARTTESRGHEPTGVDLRSGSSNKALEPEWETTRPRYQLTRRRVGKPWVQHADQLGGLPARQRAKPETPEMLRR